MEEPAVFSGNRDEEVDEFNRGDFEQEIMDGHQKFANTESNFQRNNPSGLEGDERTGEFNQAVEEVPRPSTAGEVPSFSLEGLKRALAQNVV